MWKRIRWFLKEFLIDSVFQGIWYAFSAAKVVAAVIGGAITWIVKALADINLLLIVLIFLVSWAVFIIAIDAILQWRGKSKLKVLFCDNHGRPIKKPEATFWIMGTNMISYLIQGYFQLENLSNEDTRLKSGSVYVIAKGKELARNRDISQFPIDLKVERRSSTRNPIRLHSQNIVDEYAVRLQVGTDYGAIDLVLEIEAIGLKPAKVRFSKAYRSPLN